MKINYSSTLSRARTLSYNDIFHKYRGQILMSGCLSLSFAYFCFCFFFDYFLCLGKFMVIFNAWNMNVLCNLIVAVWFDANHCEREKKRNWMNMNKIREQRAPKLSTIGKEGKKKNYLSFVLFVLYIRNIRCSTNWYIQCLQVNGIRKYLSV